MYGQRTHAYLTQSGEAWPERGSEVMGSEVDCVSTSDPVKIGTLLSEASMKVRLVLAVSGLMWVVALGHSALRAQSTTKSIWDGVYTEAQATRGGETYKKSCIRCHLETLKGKDDAAPLTGPDFMDSYKNKLVNALYNKIRTSMPDDDPGSLTDAQVADVIAYIFQFNKFPAGKDELPTDTAKLKLIKIEPAKK